MPRWPENPDDLRTWRPQGFSTWKRSNITIFQVKYLVCSSFLNVILFRSILSSSPSLSDHQTCPTGGASLGASAAAILSGPETTFSGRVRIPSAEWLSVRLCVRAPSRAPSLVGLFNSPKSLQTDMQFVSFFSSGERKASHPLSVIEHEDTFINHCVCHQSIDGILQPHGDGIECKSRTSCRGLMEKPELLALRRIRRWGICQPSSHSHSLELKLLVE